MQKTSPASSLRPTRLVAIWGSAIVSCAALATAAGCTSGEAGPNGATGAVSGGGATSAAGASGRVGTGGTGTSGSGLGGSSVGSGGGSVAGGGGSPTGVGGTGSGGTLPGSGGAGTGASVAGSAGTGTAGGGGTGGTAEPCVDVEPPPDPEWPDATCQSWANETTECAADWFQPYCDVSCGRCVPSGSGGSGGGVGGSTGSGGSAGKPCVDVQPPPDPEWPDATCESWALETTECSADWFKGYCDVSCGRCVPEGGAGGSGGSAGVDCSTKGLPNVSGGDGFATRYWDCCQPHCAQFDGHKCSRDGTSRTGDQTSSCSGGGSFACYDEAPKAVDECLSYGHIAKANPNCGGCYRIQFTGQGEHNANDPGSKLIKGKQMIVKVTNTGGDVAGNQFDLMIPGGGVGRYNACSTQWNQTDLGAQYGGFLTECTGAHSAKKECVRQECMKIPAGAARDGCIWFVDWFQVADNPKFTSQPTDCPF